MKPAGASIHSPHRDVPEDERRRMMVLVFDRLGTRPTALQALVLRWVCATMRMMPGNLGTLIDELGAEQTADNIIEDLANEFQVMEQRFGAEQMQLRGGAVMLEPKRFFWGRFTGPGYTGGTNPGNGRTLACGVVCIEPMLIAGSGAKWVQIITLGAKEQYTGHIWLLASEVPAIAEALLRSVAGPLETLALDAAAKHRSDSDEKS